jgi:hypothetical protein
MVMLKGQARARAHEPFSRAAVGRNNTVHSCVRYVSRIIISCATCMPSSDDCGARVYD